MECLYNRLSCCLLNKRLLSLFLVYARATTKQTMHTCVSTKENNYGDICNPIW